jgi:hypothetical protein
MSASRPIMIPARDCPPSKIVIDGPTSAPRRCHVGRTIVEDVRSPFRNRQTDEPLMTAKGDRAVAPMQLRIPGSPAANQRPTR